MMMLSEKIQAYTNTINHALIVVVSVYITSVCLNVGVSDLRCWHMWLCTIGFQLLMAEGIMSFYASNTWSQLHSRSTKRHLHWVLQTLGATIAIIGCAIEYWNRSPTATESKWNSIHLVVGYISLFLLGVSLLNGTTAMWSAELRFCWSKPVWSKFVHNLCGLVAFVLGMVSLIYAYDTARMKYLSTPEIRVLLQCAAGVTLVLSVLAAAKSLYGLCCNIAGWDTDRMLPAIWDRTNDKV